MEIAEKEVGFAFGEFVDSRCECFVDVDGFPTADGWGVFFGGLGGFGWGDGWIEDRWVLTVCAHDGVDRL